MINKVGMRVAVMNFNGGTIEWLAKVEKMDDDQIRDLYRLALVTDTIECVAVN